MIQKTRFSQLIEACIALAALTLGGCAAGVPNMAIDEGARARIHTVRINPVVVMPPEIDFHGQSQSIAALAAGPFAMLMDDKLSAEPRAKLLHEIEDNQIDVPAILAASFARRATSDAALRIVGADVAADAQVDLVVNRYGFAIAHPGTATLYPLFSVSAVMKDAKGQIVWQGTDLMTALNSGNDTGHPIEDLLKDPQALRQAFTTGGDIVAGMLVRNWAGLEAPQNVPGILK